MPLRIDTNTSPDRGPGRKLLPLLRGSSGHSFGAVLPTVDPDLNLADPAFWRRPPAERHAAFRRLRALDSPVYFPERAGGFYALLHHRHVTAASRTPEIFISGPGVTTPRPPPR